MKRIAKAGVLAALLPLLAECAFVANWYRSDSAFQKVSPFSFESLLIWVIGVLGGAAIATLTFLFLYGVYRLAKWIIVDDLEG